MATFVHCADVHLGLRQYGVPGRFGDMARSFRAVARLAVDRGADFLLVSGDLFDKRTVSPPTYMQACRVLELLREAGVRVFAIEGNHDQYYQRDQAGWLHSLESSGLLELVKVREGKTDGGAGSVELMGDYRDCAGARIFGMRYIGASTKRELDAIAGEIDRVNSALGAPDVTILMMHFGMEGQLKHSAGGEIPYGALAPLRGVVDYLALGHYHMKYDYDGWVFNPGSPEMVRMDEYNLPKGVFLHRDGETEFIPADSVLGTRPFHRIYVEVGKDAPTPGDVRELILAEAGKAAKEVESKKAVAAAAPYRSGADGGGSGDADPLLRPVVEVDLVGRLGFPRTELDLEDLKGSVRGRLDALHVNVRFLTTTEEHSVSLQDLRGNTLRQVEARVLREKVLLDRRYAGRPDAAVDGIMGIKELVLADADGDILLGRLREAWGETVAGTGAKPEGGGERGAGGVASLDDFGDDD